jgi:hypothetical protein
MATKRARGTEQPADNMLLGAAGLVLFGFFNARPPCDTHARRTAAGRATERGSERNDLSPVSCFSCILILRRRSAHDTGRQTPTSPLLNRSIPKTHVAHTYDPSRGPVSFSCTKPGRHLPSKPIDVRTIARPPPAGRKPTQGDPGCETPTPFLYCSSPLLMHSLSMQHQVIWCASIAVTDNTPSVLGRIGLKRLDREAAPTPTRRLGLRVVHLGGE